MRTALLASVAACMFAAQPAHADEPPPVVTQHQIKVGNNVLKYTAEAGRIAIRDVQTGEPHAWMFYTSYRVQQTDKGDRKRPVTFVWGGGPGQGGMVINFALAGPLRAEGDLHDGEKLIDNDRTWLTDTDLVVIDQVGTGYSRATRSDYAAEFNGTIGDTNSFAEFIRCWRIQHDAEDTPVFVGGVSWGAPRSATVGYKLLTLGIPLHGTILVTGETSLNKPYISPLLFEALRVVGMAEVARYHNRLPPNLGTDRDAVAEAADTWVRQTYVPALERKASLTDAERNEIVAGLSRFTGVPADAIDRETLILTPSQFRAGLFRDQNKKLNGVDTRRTEPQPGGRWAPAAFRHLKYDLKYRTDLPYRGLGMDTTSGFAPSGKMPPAAGEDWVYATSDVPPAEAKAIIDAAAKRGGGPGTVGIPLPATEEAVLLNPKLKVLILLGRYDGESTCPSNAALEQNLPPHLKQAMKFICYDAGHGPYRTPGIAVQMTNDIRAFIRSAL